MFCHLATHESAALMSCVRVCKVRWGCCAPHAPLCANMRKAKSVGMRRCLHDIRCCVYQTLTGLFISTKSSFSKWLELFHYCMFTPQSDPNELCTFHTVHLPACHQANVGNRGTGWEQTSQREHHASARARCFGKDEEEQFELCCSTFCRFVDCLVCGWVNWRKVQY